MSMEFSSEKIKAHIGGVELQKHGRLCDAIIGHYVYVYVSDIHLCIFAPFFNYSIHLFRMIWRDSQRTNPNFPTLVKDT
jgi:hypothetical protein